MTRPFLAPFIHRVSDKSHSVCRVPQKSLSWVGNIGGSVVTRCNQKLHHITLERPFSVLFDQPTTVKLGVGCPPACHPAWPPIMLC